MACKLLKFIVQVTEAYDKFDLKHVYDLTIDFLAKYGCVEKPETH